MRAKWVIAALLTAFVAGITIFFRVPIPKSGGYLNLGDVVIVFAGLYLGKGYGAFVGGVGSAIADAVGFPIFIMPTLVIKGLEGLLSGTMPKTKVLGPILGAMAMVAGYYLTEAYIFAGDMGVAAARAELPFNVLQGAVGVIGGVVMHRTIRRWTAGNNRSSES